MQCVHVQRSECEAGSNSGWGTQQGKVRPLPLVLIPPPQPLLHTTQHHLRRHHLQLNLDRHFIPTYAKYLHAVLRAMAQ